MIKWMCYTHLKKTLKKTLNHGLVLEKLQRIIKYKQKASLKSYIDMNLRKKNKKWFWGKFFQVDEYCIFGKVRKS